MTALTEWQTLWADLWRLGLGLALLDGRATLTHEVEGERRTLTLEQCGRLACIPPPRPSHEEPTLLLDGTKLHGVLIHPVESQ